MTTIGVREFRARLSRYLKLVAAGQRLVVTDRGRPVASVQAVDESPDYQWIRCLVSAGRASWGGGKPKGTPRPIVAKPGKNASDIVIEDRGTRVRSGQTSG